MRGATLGGVLGLALLAAAAPARGQDEPARTLLLLGFEGSDARLVEQVAERLRLALGVAVEVLPDRPRPDEREAIDRRADELPFIAQHLDLDPAGPPEALERRIRAALERDEQPHARAVERLVDEVCSVRLWAPALVTQVAQAAGERLQAPGVVGVLGVTARDLAAPERNFVFGLGDRPARAGVLSYVRFRAGAEEEVLARRAAVQALSTTGVLLGLGRCQRETCARAFPNSLEEHDRKQEAFCAACRPAIDRALPNPLRLPFAAELARVHRALAERPDDVARLLERAALRGEVANWSGALADYRRVLELDPASVPAREGAATAEARVALRHRSAPRVDDADYPHGPGIGGPWAGADPRLWGDQHSVRELAGVLAERLVVAPDDVDAQAQRAVALARERDWAAARAWAARALEALPPADRRRPLLERVAAVAAAAASPPPSAAGTAPEHLEGLQLARAGRHADALSAFDRALAAEPDRPEVLLARASSHYALRDWARCVADLERALALRPFDAEAYRTRGFALAQQGRLREALVDCEAARALIGYPGDPQVARQLVSTIEALRGRLER